MKKKIILLIYMQLLATAVFSQETTRQEVDSMIYALKESKPDVGRMDLLLNLAQFHIFKPGELQVDFDSAVVYINEAKALNIALKSPETDGYLLLTETLMLREKGQREAARKMNEEAVRILEKGTNKFYLAYAYYELSWYYDYSKVVEFAEKVRLLEQSVKLFRLGAPTRKEARALGMLGDLYVFGENSKAHEVLRQAEKAYSAIGDPRLQGIYSNLGAAYLADGDYGQSLFYLLKALRTARAVGDASMQLCNINNSLAMVYLAIERNDMAITYMNDALDVARKHKDDRAICLVVRNLALTLDKVGQFQQALDVLASIPESTRLTLSKENEFLLREPYLRIYLSLKQYDKAHAVIGPLLASVADAEIGARPRASVYRYVATYYFKMNQYAKARMYLMKSQNIVKKTRITTVNAYDFLLWYKLDSAQGDFRAAFNHLLFYKTKMDSILSEDRVRQLAVLGVEYETTLKEDSIKLMDKNILLLTQQNTLQQARLEQANLVRNVTIGGTVFALVIIGLLFRLYRQKQKSNHVITQKNEQLQHLLTEKEWLLKEIHHRVKNNLQIVMSLLNSQSAYIDNGPALTAINDSQHRVHAISLIHQKLYSTDNVSSIDISFYIRELVSYVSDCFNVGQRIRFELNIEKLEMDVSQAVPLGLILNEAITNAIKYAFPDERKGVVSISLMATDTPHHFLLEISDNGVGLARDVDVKRPGSLGMSLIAGLSEDLDGSFSIESTQGTTLKITFVHEPVVKRPA